MRELRTRYGQSRIGYAWAVLEPLGQIGLLYGLFSLMGRPPPLGTSLAPFFFTGYLPFYVFREIATRTGGAIQSNRALLSFPPVQHLDTIWARIVLEFFTAVAVIILLLLTFWAFGVPITVARISEALAGFASAVVLGSGFGIFNAVIGTIFGLWSTVFAWIARLQYFVCGVFFVADSLPPGFQAVVVLNPLAHCVIWIRQGVYDGYQSALLHKAYPLLFGLALAVTGLAVERLFRRRVAAR